MKGLSERNRYYLLAGIPLVLLFYILVLLNVSMVNRLYYLVGYVWPFVLMTPGIAERSAQKKYRFSLLTLSYKFTAILYRRLGGEGNRFIASLTRAILPSLFVSLLYFIGRNGFPFFAILGWASFESLIFLFEWFFLRKKKQEL